MTTNVKKLYKKEIQELNKVIKELRDIKERTKQGINILKIIVETLEKQGQSEKAKELRREIIILEEEESDERRAEHLVSIVEESLKDIIV